MTPDRWQQISQLYHGALARDVSQRARFVADACAGDEALRQEVESLLAREATVEGFMAAPALEVAAKAVRGEQERSLIGGHIGSYEILSLLGAGGMGEVYRARDTKLGRDVAIKVLPSSFARDPDRLHHLKREARLLAALNHPHIGAIHGLEDADGVPALILELVEGPTLADRLAAGPVPVHEALTLAGQVAEALEAAHEKGIIHRDLKPANIKLTPDGTVKVLDFGLAKAFIGDGSGPDLSRLPTMTMETSQEGVIAGTPAYMSPEQARGKAVDKRTDIWAFGWPRNVQGRNHRGHDCGNLGARAGLARAARADAAGHSAPPAAVSRKGFETPPPRHRRHALGDRGCVNRRPTSA